MGGATGTTIQYVMSAEDAQAVQALLKQQQMLEKITGQFRRAAKESSGYFTSLSKLARSSAYAAASYLAIDTVKRSITSTVQVIDEYADKRAKFERDLTGLLSVGSNVRNIQAVKQEVLDTSTAYKKSREEVSNFFYELQSGAVNLSRGVQDRIKKEALELATVTGEDLPISMRVLLKTFQVYGDELRQVEVAQNKLFIGAERGYMSFSDLATLLPDVLPAARAMKVGFDDVIGSLVVATQVGGRNEKTFTGIRNVFLSMLEAEKKGIQLTGDFTQRLEQLRDMGPLTLLELGGRESMAVFQSLVERIPQIRAEAENLRKSANIDYAGQRLQVRTATDPSYVYGQLVDSLRELSQENHLLSGATEAQRAAILLMLKEVSFKKAAPDFLDWTSGLFKYITPIGSTGKDFTQILDRAGRTDLAKKANEYLDGGQVELTKFTDHDRSLRQWNKERDKSATGPFWTTEMAEGVTEMATKLQTMIRKMGHDFDTKVEVRNPFTEFKSRLGGLKVSLEGDKSAVSLDRILRVITEMFAYSKTMSKMQIPGSPSAGNLSAQLKELAWSVREISKLAGVARLAGSSGPFALAAGIGAGGAGALVATKDTWAPAMAKAKVPGAFTGEGTKATISEEGFKELYKARQRDSAEEDRARREEAYRVMTEGGGVAPEPPRKWQGVTKANETPEEKKRRLAEWDASEKERYDREMAAYNAKSGDGRDKAMRAFGFSQGHDAEGKPFWRGDGTMSKDQAEAAIRAAEFKQQNGYFLQDKEESDKAQMRQQFIDYYTQGMTFDEGATEEDKAKAAYSQMRKGGGPFQDRGKFLFGHAFGKESVDDWEKGYQKEEDYQKFKGDLDKIIAPGSSFGTSYKSAQDYLGKYVDEGKTDSDKKKREAEASEYFQRYYTESVGGEGASEEETAQMDLLQGLIDNKTALQENTEALNKSTEQKGTSESKAESGAKSKSSSGSKAPEPPRRD